MRRQQVLIETEVVNGVKRPTVRQWQIWISLSETIIPVEPFCKGLHPDVARATNPWKAAGRPD